MRTWFTVLETFSSALAYDVALTLPVMEKELASGDVRDAELSLQSLKKKLFETSAALAGIEKCLDAMREAQAAGKLVVLPDSVTARRKLAYLHPAIVAKN
jgi:hypothetical protein